MKINVLNLLKSFTDYVNIFKFEMYCIVDVISEIIHFNKFFNKRFHEHFEIFNHFFL
jgi:hypothetical protein